MLPAQAHDFSHFPGCVIGQSKLLEFPLRETILKLIVRCTATCHNDSEINKKVFSCLFVELVASPEGVHDWIEVIGGVQVEEVHAVGPQSLQRSLQLRAHTFRFQRFAVPRVCLGGNADWIQRRKRHKSII